MLSKKNLHQYQLDIIARVKPLDNCALFLSMGCGKSIITLTVLAETKRTNVLIVAPLQVARNVWEAEVSKWEHTKHLTTSTITGSEKQRIAAINTKADLYITNYEQLNWLDRKGFLKNFSHFVFDESARLKSASTQRFKILKRFFKTRTTGTTMLLSGTPSPNTIEDLWAPIGLLDKGQRLETSLTKFRELYMVAGQRNRHTGVVYNWAPKPDALVKVKDKISDIAFSMQAKDYLAMPKENFVYHNITLSQPIMEAYKALKKDLVSELGGQQITAVTAATAITKMLQVTSGAIYDEERNVVHIHDDKIDLLSELLESDNAPVLLFYNFKHSLDRIRRAFPDAKMVDDSSIAQWKAGKLKMLIGHPQSIGEGLNLQNNTSDVAHVIWFDLFFSSTLYEQGNARVARQGQTSPVMIHHMIAKDTVDEHVVKVLEKKIELQNILIEALKM
jgi:SNF2 family DNA or RNA helicase